MMTCFLHVIWNCDDTPSMINIAVMKCLNMDLRHAFNDKYKIYNVFLARGNCDDMSPLVRLINDDTSLIVRGIYDDITR